jgi:hypothetical protein
MAISHDASTVAGRRLCDTLYQRLLVQIPELKRETLNRGCAFVEVDQPKLCYIFHFKKSDKIQIWPYFDYLRLDFLKEVVSTFGLPITPRNSISGMARLYPLPIELWSGRDAEGAAKVLLFARAEKQKARSIGKVSQIGRLTSQKRKPTVMFAEELTETSMFPEGGRKTIIVNAYECNGRARDLCVKHYGAICSVCGFDFEWQYGTLGKGFIHVHHIIQISTIRKKYKIDAKKDLRPVCPNCHAMLHRESETMSIEALKAILAAVHKLH